MATNKYPILAFLILILQTGCGDLNNSNGYPYGGGYGSSSGYGNSYDRSSSYERREIERERRRLDRERRELERERRNHEHRRDNNRNDGWRSNRHQNTAKPVQRIAPQPPKKVSCPSGFKPRRSKCSDAERRKGCRDTRSPSGQLCVDY